MAVDKDLRIVMNTIDESKKHMSEGKYLKTCDSIKRLHTKLQRPSLPSPNEIRIPITKNIFYIFTALKVLETIKNRFTN